MTDIDTMKYWKERLDNELNAGEKSDCQEIQRTKSVLRRRMWELLKEYNTLEEQEVRAKWHWWWMYNLAKRVLKKFNVKNIYKSKKATEYWRKLYMNKKCKMASHPLEYWGKEEVVGFLMQMRCKDLENWNAYTTVIEKIEEMTNE